MEEFIMKKNEMRFLEGNEVLVTKAFEKKARIYGTEEFKKWRELKKEFPEAEMVTKAKREDNRKVKTKNMKYKNMEAYILEQENAEELIKEFEKQIRLSKIQTSPYRAVLAWFCETFKDYDGYKEYFKNLKVA